MFPVLFCFFINIGIGSAEDCYWVWIDYKINLLYQKIYTTYAVIHLLKLNCY